MAARPEALPENCDAYAVDKCKCLVGCPYHEYFPPGVPQSGPNFKVVAGIYNRKYIKDILKAHVPEDRRPLAIQCLIREANYNNANHVKGKTNQFVYESFSFLQSC